MSSTHAGALDKPNATNVTGKRNSILGLGSVTSTSRTSERVMMQNSYASDPKYKKYVQQVDKCLNGFDNVQEWADCIAFLKQLLKTFQTYMQFKEIPKKLIVAKRLSQCLNPALPTGVHQRALDVYSHVLVVRGSEGLKQDLAIWSSGLFPFFEYAATSVKPTLLSIFDTYYLPLQSDLRPVMKSFILALLPGLEEETGEYFEKVLALLDKLSGTVSHSFFFQNIWLVMLTTPSARGTSLNFLARRLPRMNADEDLTPIVGRDIGLMIRAFSAALEDENLLVRRSALDILLQSIKIDGFSVKKAHEEDKSILMKAATSVVLRRDLSLNRRLYTWLLGQEEKSEVMVEFLKKNALDLLCSTLKAEMISPSGEYMESRPFKIFISLLDKWEIGAPLTEALVYDAFKAVKKLMESPVESREDVSTTASTLYEAVEPQILWKYLLTGVSKELWGEGNEIEAIELVRFILRSFPQDEEIQTLHLPVIFAGLVDIVNLQIKNDPTKASRKAFQHTMLLLEELHNSIPQIALMGRPQINNKNTNEQRPYEFAYTFFQISISSIHPNPIPESESKSKSETIPFCSVFESLVSTLSICAKKIKNDRYVGEVYGQLLGLMNDLVGRLGKENDVNVEWEPKVWLETVLESIEDESIIFRIIDRVINLSITLHQASHLKPKLNLDDRNVMFKMVNRLLDYLKPEYASYHTRAVKLIWELEDVGESGKNVGVGVKLKVKKGYVESILAQSMNSPESRNVGGAYEAFGVLWRLSDDNLLPGFKFKVPMMIVLDALKSEDPSLRRIGETWMRCSLKSYLRILDPILYELLDPAILRTPAQIKVHGKEIQGFVYEKPFDQRYINYLLEVLLSIVKFGGQGFAKTAKSSNIGRSNYPGLIQRVESGNMPSSDESYLEVLVEILLRFLQSEPKNQWAPIMLPLNGLLQSSTIELLQLMVSRGEIQSTTIEAMEAVVIGKLYFCIHMKRLDLQNKLLHLLHSLISVSTSIASDPSQITTSGTGTGVGIPGSGKQKQDESPVGSAQDLDNRSTNTNGGFRTYSTNPLLIQTLIDGISTKSNRPILQHWLDFILMAIPQFQPALYSLVIPLNDCLCRQLHLSLRELQLAKKQKDDYYRDVNVWVTDADMIMLLNALERFVLLGLAYTEVDGGDEDDVGTGNQDGVAGGGGGGGASGGSGSGGGGLLGYVSNVFSSESTQSMNTDQLTSRSPAYRGLDEGIRVLYSIWSVLVWTKPEPESAKDESLAMIYNRTRARCRRAMEYLFRVQSAEVFESIVECWNRDKQVPVDSTGDPAFDIIDILVANAQNAVHMTCESIWCRISGVSERNKKQAINPNLSDTVLFKFLEQYMARLEGPVAIQVWGRYMQLAKEIASSTRDFKIQSFPALKCLYVLAQKITQTSAMEDKRVRKEFQDTYSKLLDACVALVGRSHDHGSWIRRSTKDSLVTNGRESPAPRDGKEEKLDTSVSSIPTPDTPKQDSSMEYISQVILFVATSVLPNLRKFLVDNDKVAYSCNNIVYYIVTPSMRNKTRPMDVDGVIISMLRELARIPAALKAWKAPIIDLFNDNRLFNSLPDEAVPWKPIIKSFFDADKTAFPELLSKVATAPSANIFTNREYEMLLRSLNVRRLSFVVFTAEPNHFLTQLPVIQEKLVDILRNVTAPIVQSEVFLCVRVLLCRLSKHNLTSFWPVLLTELFRIFEQTMTNLPPDGSEDLQCILAACKCLDLLVTLQTEEFQIHQWIFITDTVDAIYRPDNWSPEGMMDQLAEVTGNLPIGDSRKSTLTTYETPIVDSQRALRRPLLNGVKQIESIRDLISFLSNISISSYESMYASAGNVDWEAVENGIMEDLFDGR